jgi:hypothetical protein
MQLRLLLIREDGSELELAQSFQYSQVIEPNSVKAMLINNMILSELDDTFQIGINTDQGTLQAIHRSEILCKLTSMKESDC